MPAYKNKVWDGKIRLFSTATGRIYVGLLGYLKKFCDRNDVQINIDEGVEDVKKIGREVVEDLSNLLNPNPEVNLLSCVIIKLMQWNMVLSHIVVFLFLLLLKRKSLIIYSLVRYYKMMGLKTLILFPLLHLVEQMYSDFKDYGWSSDNIVKRYIKVMIRMLSKDVVISTWQSIYKMKKEYFEHFGCVIGDEMHLFKSKSLTNIMTKLVYVNIDLD